MRLSILLLSCRTVAGVPRDTPTLPPALSLKRASNAAAGIPLPSPSQLTALAHPFTIFMHYSMCTYTGCQWNTAVSPAQDFAPPDSGPNATQWAEAALAAGASQICLTVRHVGGFALWPTRTTNYSVAASGWRGGKGDVVAEFVAAVRAVGISPCLYIIMGFDVEAAHANVPGGTYLDRQVEVLTELLTNYGPIDRLWWDNYAIGCCQPVTHQFLYCDGGSTFSTPGPSCPGWQVLIDTVRALSPSTAIVPGPDGCLVNGEELGGTYPLYHATSLAENSYTCTDARAPFGGPFFAVPESDFSMAHSWFWGPGDAGLNASQIAAQVSVKLEQGSSMILNVPPNSSGVVEDDFVATLARVGAARRATFGDPRAALPAPVAAACAALSITLPVNGTFDTVLLMEDLSAGQVVAAYTLEVLDAGGGGGWRRLTAGVHGATVGARLVDAVSPQANVTALRFNCSADLSPPNPPPAAAFTLVNGGGACLGLHPNASWPCYTGGEGPFALCPLVAAPCASAGAVAWVGGAGGALAAPGVAADAVVNVDCDACAAGTHAKLISNGRCNCASPLAFNASAGALQAVACPGMCLSDGAAPGALPSCAGSEPWEPTQVHLVPCQGARGSWARVPAKAPPPTATIAFLGAFLQRPV